MLIRRKLPAEVSSDIIKWITSRDKEARRVLAMNKEVLRGLADPEATTTIDIPIANNVFTFDWAEHPPPSGVMAANYARYLFLTTPILHLLTTK